MTSSLSEDQVRRLRLRSQRLTGERPGAVDQVVRAVVGLQAQEARAARLAVRPRSVGLDAAAVRRACDLGRSVVRTWAMRGTLHMVAAEDLGWLVGLLGPVFAAAGRRRRLQLGLDDDLCARALPAIRGVLAADGPLPRAELVERLAGAGVAIDPAGQAPAHLVAYAAMRGLLCRGPDLEGDEPSYVLLDDWVGGRPALEPDAALAELARRYLGGYGPASPRDLAAWAGIPLGRARHGFRLVAGELRELDAAGEPAWVLADRPEGSGAPPWNSPVDPDLPEAGEPCVRLLPHFDAWLLGWRGRERILDSRFARRVQAGGGWLHPTVVVDGRVGGTWRLRRTGDRLTVAVAPFRRLAPELLPGLRAETADVGRFLGAEATLAVEDP